MRVKVRILITLFVENQRQSLKNITVERMLIWAFIFALALAFQEPLKTWQATEANATTDKLLTGKGLIRRLIIESNRINYKL